MIVLLKDNLDGILMNFDTNFTNEEVNILKKVATDERIINYSHCFFEKGDPIIKNFDFLKRFGNCMTYCLTCLMKK